MKKNHNHKVISAIIAIFGSLFWIYVGIMFIVSTNVVIKNIYVISFAILVIYTVSKLINIFVNKQRKEYFKEIALAIINIGIGIYIYYNINLFAKSIILIFSLYLLVLSIIEIINASIYHANNIKGIAKPIIYSILPLIMTIILLFNKNNVNIAFLIFGIYFIIYGSLELLSILSSFLPQNMQQQFRLALPSIIAMFIPKLLMNQIQKTMEDDKFKEIKVQKKPGRANLFVVIHLAKGGTAAYGHIEIATGGKTYSFGNYDSHSPTLFDSIGNGVIAVCDKSKYTRYQVVQNERYLFEFGIHMTPVETIKIKRELKKILNNTEVFHSDLELCEHGKIEPGNYEDATSKMYKYCDAKFYKIKSGIHKKFYLFQSNCTWLPETMLDILGLHIHSVNGILAPGNYVNYLNKEFQMDNSKVVLKRIYTKEDFE